MISTFLDFVSRLAIVAETVEKAVFKTKDYPALWLVG